MELIPKSSKTVTVKFQQEASNVFESESKLSFTISVAKLLTFRLSDFPSQKFCVIYMKAGTYGHKKKKKKKGKKRQDFH